MKRTIQIIPKILHFKKPAGTSRGIYTTRKIWYLHLYSDDFPNRVGIGECAPLPKLSCDDIPEYEKFLRETCTNYEHSGSIDYEKLRNFPSILFGLETAERNLKNGTILWENDFSSGKKGIPINGLIWMGDFDSMYNQIQKKIDDGFRCIKLKIGAIDFEEELKLIRYIRSRFSVEQIEIRVDANGAFNTQDALKKLQQLAELDLHSIEQPIKAGQVEKMADLVQKTPLPIALDEELIGINTKEAKEKLLDTIQPHYIILKPSLHGGIQGSEEWIELAKQRNIQWWITSALESNIGLNAIAQWCASLNNPLPQGLGTGMLYTDNIDMPLKIIQDSLWYKQ